MGGRQPAPLEHGRRRVQARRPGADLPEVRVGRVRQPPASLEAAVEDHDSDYYMPTEAARQSVLEDRDEYTAEGVFWVPEGHRWDDLRKAAKQPDIGARIDAAMDAIEKENPIPEGRAAEELRPPGTDPATLGGLIDTFSRDDLAAAEHDGPRRPRTGLRVLPRPVRLRRGQERRRVLHAPLGRLADGRDARTLQRARVRPRLRLGRHVRPGGPASSRPTAGYATTSPSSGRSRTPPRGGSRR